MICNWKQHFDIQRFAAAGTQTTGTSTLSAEMKTFYDKTLLDNAEPQLVHDQFGQERNIPAHGGKTIEFRKFSSLAKATTALTEGVTPEGQKLNMGVITALEALNEPCVVELYSDSKYVIDALEKGWARGWQKRNWVKSDKKPALNPDLWQTLLSLCDTHDVHCHWVKGHAENEYNNRCDELAVAESRKYK